MEPNVMTESAAPKTTYSENPPQLFLVSEDSLQNKILANAISKGLDTHCTIIESQSSEHTQKLLNHPDEEKLLCIIDCQKIGYKETDNLLYQLQEQAPKAHVALLNATESEQLQQLLLWPQVKGLFFEHHDLACVTQGLKALMEDDMWLPRGVMEKLLVGYRKPQKRQAPQKALTQRERQILEEVSKGATNQEIAEMIHVSSHTVKSHLYNIYKKIGVKNRMQARNWAEENFGEF